MSGSVQIVVRPADLRLLAARFDLAANDARSARRRVSTFTAGVRLNGRDPGFGFGEFHRRRVGLERRLQALGVEWADDSSVVLLTIDQAAAADTGSGLAVRVDRVSAVVAAQPASNQSGVFYDEMLASRRELLAELAGGSWAAVHVFDRYVAGGGSMVALFDAAWCRPSGGGADAHDRVHELVAEGRIDEAKVIDDALAVGSLLVSTSSGIRPGLEPGSSGGGHLSVGLMMFGERLYRPSRVDLFDNMVASGVDAGVAANTARVGRTLPSAAELSALVDQLGVGYTEGRSPTGSATARLTEQQRAWLPFGVRMILAGHQRPGLTSSDRAVGVAGGGATGLVVPKVAEVMVIGELGRAGLDHSRGLVLAQRLVDRVVPGSGGGLGWGPAKGAESARSPVVQALAAELLADPTTGLDAAFVSLLGVDGLTELTRAVMESEPSTMDQLAGFGDRERLAILGGYGDALAHLDRRGSLGIEPADLVAPLPQSRYSPVYLLGGRVPFSSDFAVEAARLVVEQPVSAFGVTEYDPRGFALNQVAVNGPDAGLALIKALGDDYLDDLLFNPEPITAPSVEHPVYKVFEPLLDHQLIPGLDVMLMERAGAVATGGGRLAQATGQVLERAVLNDVELLSPLAVTKHGDSPMVDPMVAVHATQAVFAAGAGEQLMSTKAVLVPTLTSGVRVEGFGSVTDRVIDARGEMVAVIDIGFESALLANAAERDSFNARIKLWAPAAVTAVAGGVFTGPTEALIVKGFGANIGVGVGAEGLLSTGHQLDVYQQLWLNQDDWSGSIADQVLWALQRNQAIDYHGDLDITASIDNYTIRMEQTHNTGALGSPAVVAEPVTFGDFTKFMGRLNDASDQYGRSYRDLITS